MNKGDWIETRKECEVDSTGQLTVRKITLERKRGHYLGLERKEIIDIALRLLSLGAIFIPLFLFYKQQKAERDKQRTFFQLELYSTTTTQLNSLVNQPLGSTGFDQAQGKILYEIYPKLRLLSEDVVVDSFLVLKDIIYYSSIMAKGFNASDSLRKMITRTAESGRNRYEGKEENSLTETFSGSLQSLDGSIKELRKWKAETQQGKAFSKPFQETMIKAFSTLRAQADASLEILRGNGQNDGMGRSVDLAGSEVLERFYSAYGAVLALKTNYSNQFNVETQLYTSRLDSIMAESTKQLYSK